MPDPPGARLPPALLANRADFLAFLERRLGGRDAAEEMLQAAYLKAMDGAGSIADEESTVAWFYRLLRNAIVDRHRRRGAEARALERHAAELAAEEGREDEPLHAAVCRCVDGLVPVIKPEYGEILRAVDLGGAAVADVAERFGISPNNAAVRLHRARAALRVQLQRTCGACAQHGCLDCSCARPHVEGSGKEV